MRPALRAFVAGGLGFAVSLIAACGGSSNVLPSDQATALRTKLDQLQLALNSGDCAGVTSALDGLASDVNNLPTSVNDTIRANLATGVSTVERLASAKCPTPGTSRTTTTHTTTTPTTTQTVPTTPTTTPAHTTTTTTPATTPTTPGTNTSTGPGSGGAGLAPGSTGGSGNSSNG
jgi:hypothetical protein